MKLYLDYNVRAKCYYLDPFQIDKRGKYLIRFETRVAAESLLRKINLLNNPTPFDEQGLYKLIGLEENEQVKIFTLGS
jgi:hypothetical protein